MSAEPHRFVDRHGHGWFLPMSADGTSAPYICVDVPDLQYLSVQDAQLDGREPRVVRAPTPVEEHQLAEAFKALKRFGLVGVCMALTRCAFWLECDCDCNVSEWRLRMMTAGRPGSHESVRLREMISYGLRNRLAEDLWILGGEHHVDALLNVYTTWVASTESYVEVAENTAEIIGPLIDDAGGMKTFDLGKWNRMRDTIRYCLASRAYRTEFGGEAL